MRRGLGVLALMIGAGWITAGAGAALDKVQANSLAQGLAASERLHAEQRADREIAEAKTAMDEELAVFDRKIAKAESQLSERKGSSDKTAAELDEKIDRLIEEKAEEENPRVARKLDADLARLMRQRDQIDAKPDAERDRLTAKIETLKKERDEARLALTAKVAEAEAAKALAVVEISAPPIGQWWRPLFGVLIGLALLGGGIVLLVTAPQPPPRRMRPEAAPPTTIVRRETSVVNGAAPEEITATLQDAPPPEPRLPSSPPPLPEAALAEAPISQIEAPADVAETIGVGTPLGAIAEDLESTMDVRSRNPLPEVAAVIEAPVEMVQSNNDTELVSADQLPAGVS